MLISGQILPPKVHMVHREEKQHHTKHPYKQSRKTPASYFVPVLSQIGIWVDIFFPQFGYMEDEAYKTCEGAAEEKEGKSEVISLADAGSHEGTVMVVYLDAGVTVLAVEGPRRFYDAASRADS